MTTNNQKQEILRSLNNLDAAQTERVLTFIRSMQHNEQRNRYHHFVKRKAMREIVQALQQTQPSF